MLLQNKNALLLGIREIFNKQSRLAFTLSPLLWATYIRETWKPLEIAIHHDEENFYAATLQNLLNTYNCKEN